MNANQIVNQAIDRSTQSGHVAHVRLSKDACDEDVSEKKSLLRRIREILSEECSGYEAKKARVEFWGQNPNQWKVTVHL
ncbi:MAG: hypothetical protein WC551_07790 [Patescibacteria group bacterium]